MNILDRYVIYRLSTIYYNAIKTADKIIAISKYTKQDILCLFPHIQEEKIEVIYNSVLLPNNVIKPLNFSYTKYLLYVNTLQEYKNIFTLIKAYQKILDKTDYPLVIVGKKTAYWEEVIVPYIKINNFMNRIIVLSNLREEELKYLYKNAKLFISPSLHEGFGYTPIEAAICKCPVLTSIQEALPDVTDGLVNYYYPAMDDLCLANKIMEILNDPINDDELTNVSDYYKKKYSPNKQYTKIINLFYELTNE